MNIPTLPAGRNKYYDLGSTRQFDVDVIRRALLQYEGTMATRVEAAQPDSDERYCLAAERIAARGLATRRRKLDNPTNVSIEIARIAGHRGTDIPASEGTPILAAHSGTVIISGWNNSYGNQVLLDNGAGLSTRYAHMTQTAVTAGEAVTAGQVIGYVGSTGDSTGNHLHFEVMQNGVRVNPMDMVSVR